MKKEIIVSQITDMSNMFIRSKFNGDISNWKPLSLENDQNMFKNCNAPKPYWYGLTKEERIKALKALKAVEVNEKLQQNLNIKEKKNKIKI